MSDSPFFGLASDTKNHQLVMQYDDAAAQPGVVKISVAVRKMTPDSHFLTVREAEQHIFEMAEEIDGGPMPFGLNRATARVAVKTRRGRGNRVFVNAASLAKHVPVVYTDERIGRWACIEEPIPFTGDGSDARHLWYVTDDFPEDMLLTCYYGSSAMDVPCLAFGLRGVSLNIHNPFPDHTYRYFTKTKLLPFAEELRTDDRI